mmetsp:Transcript_8581/g.20979  ORF Transcript_8581/g.20979 Transcript_8581/m.20979 type:complete len:86 (+) Transcript_8581:143-400(+)
MHVAEITSWVPQVDQLLLCFSIDIHSDKVPTLRQLHFPTLLSSYIQAKCCIMYKGLNLKKFHASMNVEIITIVSKIQRLSRSKRS